MSQNNVSITEIVNNYTVSINEETEVVNVTISEQGSPGINGKSAYKEWLDLGNVGTEQDFINSLKSEYPDLELNVTQDGQTVFNIFQIATKSNLYINDCIYFQNKSYELQEINNAWKLIWLNEFPLQTNDFLIFRKLK